MDYNLDNAVNYHYGKFPPEHINYEIFIEELIKATETLARFDQMIKNLHNSELLLAPLRNQEAVLSSRIEGTIRLLMKFYNMRLIMIAVCLKMLELM
jgi:Fic family protein